jgi:hypothetical protein
LVRANPLSIPRIKACNGRLSNSRKGSQRLKKINPLFRRDFHRGVKIMLMILLLILQKSNSSPEILNRQRRSRELIVKSMMQRSTPLSDKMPKRIAISQRRFKI